MGIFQREPGTPLADGTALVIDAMKKVDIDRFVVMSSLGVGDSAGQGNWLVRLLTRTRLKFVMIDKNAQEALIRESGLNWTIIRPPRIMPGAVDPHFLKWEGSDCQGKPKWQISAATAAHAMLDCLQDSKSFHRAFQISN